MLATFASRSYTVYMNTKTLSPRALSVIDQYLHFKLGSAVCSVPYFNNRTARLKVALRAMVGKGSPREIYDEIHAVTLKSHIATDSLADESLKKMLTDNDFGIDCSGFAYYVLNTESEETKKVGLDKKLSFVNCHGFLGKMRCSLRPVENCDVSTLANDKNSRIIPLNEVQPGDMITMTGSAFAEARADQSANAANAEKTKIDPDHILLIHQVEYQNFVPYQIHYSHAVAYPEDGVYGTGIKQGMIEVTDVNRPITVAKWIEDGKESESNRLFQRAQKSKTEVRRLNWI